MIHEMAKFHLQLGFQTAAKPLKKQIALTQPHQARKRNNRRKRPYHWGFSA
jgi:hypothetical protein